MQQARLTRSRREQMIAGVCGGLAEYFSIDVTIVRLVFVLMGFMAGSSALLYIALWILLPQEGSQLPNSQSTIQSNLTDMRQQAQSVFERFRGSNNAPSQQANWQFDPYTGQPIEKPQPEQAKRPRFDPYTGEPINHE